MTKSNPRVKAYTRRQKNLRKVGFSSYFEYLTSDIWQSIRKQIFSKRKNECKICGSRRYLQLHHLVYTKNSLTSKQLGNIVMVCRKCHSKLSDLEKRKKLSPCEAYTVIKKEHAALIALAGARRIKAPECRKAQAQN